LRHLAALLRGILTHTRDVAPIVAVFAFFQLAVLRQPMPDLVERLGGLAVLILGLALFMRGLELALFPAGEGIARALARRGSLPWLVAFSFLLGFGTAMAEPALIAIAGHAAHAAAQAGLIADSPQAHSAYALALRLAVALGVGAALVLGVLRTVKGWPVHWLLAGGVLGVAVVLAMMPTDFAAIALDSGGVTLSTISVPLITALGVGLASSIRGRSPLPDGFGLVALTAMLPILFVVAYGALLQAWMR
jgi:hypothetical protein